MCFAAKICEICAFWSVVRLYKSKSNTVFFEEFLGFLVNLNPDMGRLKFDKVIIDQGVQEFGHLQQRYIGLGSNQWRRVTL